MNKAQLVEAVAKTLDIPISWAAAPTAAVLDAIIRELAGGGKVMVTGFGTFDVVKHQERQGHNPQTMEPVTIPAHLEPRFKAGPSMKRLVNGERPLPEGSAIAKAPKGSLTPAPVDAETARLEADRKAAELTIASRRVAGQAGAR